MKTRTLLFLAAPLCFLGAACPTRVVNDADGGSAGSSATGAAGAAGATATGGQAIGGASGSGDTGGSSATGGHAGNGETGGTFGTGGVASIGGATGTGGVASTGGVTGAGGAANTGGVTGAGGVANTGGAPPPPTCNPTCSSATQTCVGTTCLFKDGQPCSLPSDCASNTCTAFFLDQDGDGYGSGTAKGYCGTSTPLGYASEGGDCCDDPSYLSVAKQIHPGAGYQTTSAGGVCGITWDYDCSGTLEVDRMDAACTPGYQPPLCPTQYVPAPASECGTPAAACECDSPTSNDSAECHVGCHGAAGTYGCK
jgi:hypothetical protein